MRLGAACLFLALCCSGAAAEVVDKPLVPLPDYFWKSFQACEVRPLKPFTLRPSQMKAVRASFGMEDLPDIIVHGVPRPPERPRADTIVTAYADETPLPPARPVIAPQAITAPSDEDGAQVSKATAGPADTPIPPGTISHAFVPQPVRRPDGIDDRLNAFAGVGTQPRQSAQPPMTKVAMLGFPGAGMAINNLARMQPLPAIVKGGCSVSQPYKLMALGPASRTTLEPAAIIDNNMANGLVRWEAGMQEAARRELGEGVVAIKVAASYSCRGMNNRKGAKLSEHAHANAIDIAGYVTQSGKEISVKEDFYGKGRNRAFLRDVHELTCDVFQVVLGPGSDGYHEDHFHMDMGHWKVCR